MDDQRHDNGAKARLMQLFSVPLVIVDNVVERGVIDGVANWIAKEERQSDSLHISNVGGWHSHPDLPARAVPVLDELFSVMTDHVRRMQAALARNEAEHPEAAPPRISIQAWAVVLQNGGYMRLHDHAAAHWSAVFYADAGNATEANSGRISFVNPVGACRSNPGIQIAPTTFDCTPVTGQLIIFPGWLQHYVEPYRGTRPRMVISANFEMPAG